MHSLISSPMPHPVRPPSRASPGRIAPTVEALLRLPEAMPDDPAFEAPEDADSITDWRAEPSYDSLFALFDECAAQDGGDAAGASVKGGFADYPAFFASLAAQRVVRPDLRDVHRRVKILGPLEARLIAVDRVVLGGLDEGVWPPAPQTDAFLNRPMRSLIGLLPPERRIGRARMISCRRPAARR